MDNFEATISAIEHLCVLLARMRQLEDNKKSLRRKDPAAYRQKLGMCVGHIAKAARQCGLFKREANTLLERSADNAFNPPRTMDEAHKRRERLSNLFVTIDNVLGSLDRYNPIRRRMVRIRARLDTEHRSLDVWMQEERRRRIDEPFELHSDEPIYLLRESTRLLSDLQRSGRIQLTRQEKDLLYMLREYVENIA